MNTKSDWSSSDCGLSSTVYGGGPGFPKSSTYLTFLGPKMPRCSHTLDEPGPPLNENVTGRSPGDRTPSRV